MTHCQRCYLTNVHPGVEIGENSLCNLCEMRLPPDLVHNFAYTQRNYDIFKASSPREDAEHDCLFMYSGGKDSTYMLDRFVHQEGRRVAAYTFNVPFESKFTEENIARVQEAIPIKFIFDADDPGIKKMMAHVFNTLKPTKPGVYLDEKKPCMLCRTFFVIKAILLAWRERIPFIILCGDPQQIITMESNVQKVAADFFRHVGSDMAVELFGEEILELAFADEDELPRIIFPYIAERHTYNPEQMIAELKAKDLYRSSPLETHCTLFPLLNYYSFKNYNCSFYKLNMSAQRRAAAGGEGNATFGIDFEPSEDMLATEAKYRDVILDIINQEGGENLNRDRLMQVFAEMNIHDGAAEYLADKYLSVHAIAQDLGVHLP